jgi:hypothetical protein
MGRGHENRIKALERQLNITSRKLIITGGLPPEASTPKPELPPGFDLKHQHAIMTGQSPQEPIQPAPGTRWRVRADQPEVDSPPLPKAHQRRP